MRFIACLLALFTVALAQRQPYNESLARLLLRYSSAAYVDAPSLCNIVPPSFQTVATFNKTLLGFGTFAYVGVDPVAEHLIVAFRGTDKVTELIEEALTDIVPTVFFPDPSLNVAPFFYASEGLIYDDMKAAVLQLLASYPGYQVYFTGHSLGAAVATITLMHMMYDNVFANSPPVVIYTFGSPRVGTYQFAQKFDSLVPNNYRLVHYRDIVAHLPPCNSGFNSKLQLVCQSTVNPSTPYLWAYQTTTEVWYQESMPDLFNEGDNGAFQVCTGQPTGEDHGCSDGLILKDSVSDHTHYFTLNGQPFEIADYCQSGAATRA